MPKHGIIKNITGKSYGRLTAMRYIKTAKDGHAIWLFRCKCGNEKEKETGPGGTIEYSYWIPSVNINLSIEDAKELATNILKACKEDK